jgi:hypothetical protein
MANNATASSSHCLVYKSYIIERSVKFSVVVNVRKETRQHQFILVIVNNYVELDAELMYKIILIV